MSKIYRYTVPVDDRRHRISLSGEIIHVGGRNIHEVEFWAVFHDDGNYRDRIFQVVGTGHNLPSDYVRVVGTSVMGTLVWHLVELSEGVL